jgi:hypothetical protein
MPAIWSCESSAHVLLNICAELMQQVGYVLRGFAKVQMKSQGCQQNAGLSMEFHFNGIAFQWNFILLELPLSRIAKMPVKWLR